MRIDAETGEILPSRTAAYSQRMRRAWQMARKYGLFTLKEQDILSALSDLINYKNQIAKGDVPLTPTQMAEELFEDRRNFMKVLKSLQSKNAVGCWHSNDVEIWYINPTLYRRGHNHKEISSAFKSAAAEYERLGAKVFNVTHENFYSSLVQQ